jgi:hypothetical protein
MKGVVDGIERDYANAKAVAKAMAERDPRCGCTEEYSQQEYLIRAEHGCVRVSDGWAYVALRRKRRFLTAPSLVVC